MCQGLEFPDRTRRSPPSTVAAGAARLETTSEEVAASRARLAEAVVQLERERARAAELRRRLAESYAERDRLRKLASVMDIVRARLTRKRLHVVDAAGNGVA